MSFNSEGAAGVIRGAKAASLTVAEIRAAWQDSYSLREGWDWRSKPEMRWRVPVPFVTAQKGAEAVLIEMPPDVRFRYVEGWDQAALCTRWEIWGSSGPNHVRLGRGTLERPSQHIVIHGAFASRREVKP